MNNEPVAYLMVERNDGNSYIQISVPTRDEKISHQPYPLYTHPAKTLTDEEIEDVYYKDFNWADEDYVKFARAILKKVSEK
jgi:hypothetical protein